jgi:hypothetical protein
VFRSGVSALGRRPVTTYALKTLRGTDQDDRSALARSPHAGRGDYDCVPHADKVDIDDIAEYIVGVRVFGAGRRDSSICYDDVDRAQCTRSLRYDILQSRRVANISFAGNDCAA